MTKFFFKPIEIIDPLTKQRRIVSVEEQEEMLEKGVLVAPVKKRDEENKNG